MGGSWVVNSRSMSTRVIAVAAAPPAAPPYSSMSFALALESSRGWSASPSDRGPRSRQASAAATGHAELTQSHNALEDSHTGSAGGVCEAYRATSSRCGDVEMSDFSLCCLLSRLPAARRGRARRSARRKARASGFTTSSELESLPRARTWHPPVANQQGPDCAATQTRPSRQLSAPRTARSQQAGRCAPPRSGRVPRQCWRRAGPCVNAAETTKF